MLPDGIGLHYRGSTATGSFRESKRRAVTSGRGPMSRPEAEQMAGRQTEEARSGAQSSRVCRWHLAKGSRIKREE